MPSDAKSGVDESSVSHLKVRWSRGTRERKIVMAEHF